MLTFCIVTIVSNLYLEFITTATPTVAFFSAREDPFTRWIINENTSTGAYRICSAFNPDWCLGIAEGRQIQNLETVVLQHKNSINMVYWNYNNVSGWIQPYGKSDIYLITMDMDRDWKPIQLWGTSDGPTFNYSTFRIEIC